MFLRAVIDGVDRASIHGTLNSGLPVQNYLNSPEVKTRSLFVGYLRSDGHNGHQKGPHMDGHTIKLCQSQLYRIFLQPSSKM